MLFVKQNKFKIDLNLENYLCKHTDAKQTLKSQPDPQRDSKRCRRFDLTAFIQLYTHSELLNTAKYSRETS